MADNDVATAKDTAMDGLSPGALLKQARTEQEKSLDDISTELHLDRWMLEAIERDDYNSLGAPVFAKGHLKQYAKLLDVDPDDLMVGYYQVCGSREQPPLVADTMLQSQTKAERNWGWVVPAVIGLLVIGAVGGAIYWYLQPTQAPESVGADRDSVNLTASTSLTQVIPAQTSNTPVAPATPAAEPAPVSADALLIPPEQAEPVPVSEPAQSGAGSIVSSNVTVTLRFNGNSWVEVYDAKRQKLLYGLVESASVKYLNGPPPISVFLGRQNAVSVEVNGESYPIPVTAMRGNTARFQIDKPQP